MASARRGPESAAKGSPVFGRLIIVRGGEAAGLREEAVPFASLAELLDLCAAGSDGAFVRVEVGDAGGAGARLLVLDFGRFGGVSVSGGRR